MTVRMAWPSPNGRVIPTAATSIRVLILQGATVVNQALLTPGSPQATITEVPVGIVTVRATAYPGAGGTGTALASAQVNQSVASGGTANVVLTMSSTIDRLTLTPGIVNLAITGLLTQQLTVTAYDAGNTVVLTAPGDLSYTTSNSLLFNVSSTGLVQGIAVGNATVTATDAISGKSATSSVRITL